MKARVGRRARLGVEACQAGEARCTASLRIQTLALETTGSP